MPISAITIKIGELNQPVITDYELGIIIFGLYKKGKIDTNITVKEYVDKLTEFGIVTRHKKFPKEKIFQITGKKGYDAGDFLCAVDPFAYVSHINAISFHGMTNRIPQSLYISTPPYRMWNRFADEKMEKDIKGQLDEYRNMDLPKLRRIKIETLNGKPVIEYESIHQGAFKKVENRKIRVSTIGRTFLDMVREPEYCGGMNHVIEVFEEYGKLNRKTIIDNVDRHGKDIEKARVGYLLEEYCDVKDKNIDKWAKKTKRGGSRKLDPGNEYSPDYSEKWSLSINVL